MKPLLATPLSNTVKQKQTKTHITTISHTHKHESFTYLFTNSANVILSEYP